MFYDGIDNRGSLAAEAPRCVMGIYPGGYEVISSKGDLIDCKIPAENSGKPVVSVGPRAFRGKKGLRCVDVPASVAKIGVEAFAGCTSLSEVAINGAVAEISSLAFFACTSLKSVKIAPGTKTISKSAFASCSSLEVIVLPSTVNTLSDEVFRDCSALSAVVLPTALVGIGRYAFFGCNSVKLYYMGSVAEWSKVRLAQGNDNISSANVLFYSEAEPTADAGAAWHYIDGVPTPWLVQPTVGGAGAPTYGSILTAMGIGTKAGDGTVTETVTSTAPVKPTAAPVGMSKYDGYCDQNFNMTLTDGGYIVEKFKGYQNTQVCVIPEEYRGRPIVGIGKSAFEDMKPLTNVVIPESIVVIGPSAFSGCTGISSIAIPSTVKVICDNAFRDCTSLLNVAFVGEELAEVGKCAFAGCKALSDIKLPKSVGIIGSGAFFECEALRSFTVPSETKKIEEDTFKYCRALATLDLANISEIGYEAFLGTALSSVELPDGVKIVDGSAFASCAALKSVVIPTSLAEVGKGAFSGSEALEMVFYKGRSEEELDRHVRFARGNDNLFGAVLYCYSELRNDDGAYWHYVDGVPTPWVVIKREEPKAEEESMADELSGIIDKMGTKGGSEKSFGTKSGFAKKGEDEERGFGSKFGGKKDGGDGGKKFGGKGGDGENGTSRFGNGDKGGDEGGKRGGTTPERDPYAKFSDNFSFANREGGCEVVRYQGSSTECIIPEEHNGKKVNSIGQSAFFGAPLKVVSATDNITSVGDFAFSRCDSLVSVDNLESVLKIGEGAFEGCSKLSSISVTSNTEIGSGAFKRCSSLKSITVSHQLTKIGTDAFSMCDSLERVYYIGLPRHFDEIDVGEGNHAFLSAKVFYYSFDRPTTSGNFWHLVDGVPTLW